MTRGFNTVTNVPSTQVLVYDLAQLHARRPVPRPHPCGGWQPDARSSHASEGSAIVESFGLRCP